MCSVNRIIKGKELEQSGSVSVQGRQIPQLTCSFYCCCPFVLFTASRNSLFLRSRCLAPHYNCWEFQFHKVITIRPQIIHLVKSIFGTGDKVGAELLHTSGEGSLLVIVSRSVNAPMRKGLTGCIFLQTVPRKNQFPDFHVVSIMEA